MSEQGDRTKLQFDPGKTEFEAYLGAQLGFVNCRLRDLSGELDAVYLRIERQFGGIRNKYFRNGNSPVLRVAHNAQYTIFLYHLARCAFENNKSGIADKIYALLRVASGVDLYYEVKLPEFWACDHPLGSVIGRARFESRATLFFAQNCNIGNNRGVYPQIDGNFHMYAGSSLLGDTRIHGNVVLSNGACVINGGHLSDCLIFGRSPHLTIKPLSKECFAEITAFKWEN
jgi:serine O-acetyltransferase